MACVAQLDEVLARVGLLDRCVGEMLNAQHPFVFTLHTREIADTDMAAKVESGRKVTVAGFVQVVGDECTHASFYKPRVLALAVETQHWFDAQYSNIAPA